MPYISISERVKDSLRRSMCKVHFDAFTDFHNNIGEFGKHNWLHFRSWLEYGIGQKVRDICLPWVTYGLSTIRRCGDCKQASVYVRNPHNDVVVVISSDSEVTEQSDEDDLDSAAKDDQSLTPTMACNSERLSK
ncbi:hypothetical protein FRX31_026935 [Thalictrum thalictroides]|uniref:Uncharacterized protein n=1 Tax=Thalictrum thalictroides TaxID=46969 RepID=A0A7J6VEH5_THATH|nr:hypothetical protein FRX31_026935 [Thalictrum thalictroides]